MKKTIVFSYRSMGIPDRMRYVVLESSDPSMLGALAIPSAEILLKTNACLSWPPLCVSAAPTTNISTNF